MCDDRALGTQLVHPLQNFADMHMSRIRLITQRADWVPIFTHTVTYGYSKQLNFKPYPDELPRFFLASWK